MAAATITGSNGIAYQSINTGVAPNLKQITLSDMVTGDSVTFLVNQDQIDQILSQLRQEEQAL